MYPLKMTSPHALHRRKDRLRSAATVCAVFSGSVSLMVLAMWAGRVTGVAAVWPPLLDMKVNAALGLAACGVALLLFIHDRPRAAMAVAMLPLLLGLTTLWEHVTGLDAHVDQLLLDDWSGSDMPGRTAPNSAAAQALLGATFLALGLTRGGGRQDLVVKLLCLVVIGIVAEAIAGHIVGSRIAVGWGSAQSMSALAAACAMMLAIGIFAHCMRAERRRFSQASLWVPALLAVGIGLLDLSTSLDYQLGLCYILLAACGIWFPRRYFLTIFTAVSIALVLFGLLAAPRGDSTLWAAIVNRGLTVGAIVLVAVLVRQHLRSQSARLHMVDHLATIQQLSQTGSFELDLATMRFTTSRGFDAIHGLRASDLRDWDRFVEAAIPADEHPAVARFVAALRLGDCAGTLDYSFLRPDGATGEAVLRCIPTIDERGMPTGITGIVQDTTRQHQREQAQLELEAKLRHAQKLESLGMLASGVAHDLNNILVPVTMLAPLLLESAEGPADRENLRLIIGSAQRAKDLVREMLTFTRKDPPTLEAVRLDLLVRDSLTILRAGLPSDITIIEELGRVSEICGSKGQLYQILLNLVINAAHAIGRRPGRITIGTCETSTPAQAHGVHLYVRDDGDGMEPETLEHVFEPFFSTKDGMQGSGIGLAIVYGIVKTHGGVISARSSRGRGAQFDLVFPVAVIGEPLCLAA